MVKHLVVPEQRSTADRAMLIFPDDIPQHGPHICRRVAHEHNTKPAHPQTTKRNNSKSTMSVATEIPHQLREVEQCEPMPFPRYVLARTRQLNQRSYVLHMHPSHHESQEINSIHINLLAGARTPEHPEETPSADHVKITMSLTRVEEHMVFLANFRHRFSEVSPAARYRSRIRADLGMFTFACEIPKHQVAIQHLSAT
jgi:hypothetical protein